MKKDVIKYGDYFGTVRYSDEDKVFYGKIEGIDDLVTFEGSSVNELVSAFEEAVEDYIVLCKQVKRPSQKSYKGSFNVRIDPDLHRKAATHAANTGHSLNQIVEEAIQSYLLNKKTDDK